ncbi:Uncharacterised protein [Acinetobacter baumannii]|nr:Uncharacterised protein [Acinetobacter baumannii]
MAKPNTQRQNTTSSTGCPESSNSQPMVPQISMAEVISSVPRRIGSFMGALPQDRPMIIQSRLPALHRITQAKTRDDLFYQGYFEKKLSRPT